MENAESLCQSCSCGQEATEQVIQQVHLYHLVLDYVTCTVILVALCRLIRGRFYGTSLVVCIRSRKTLIIINSSFWESISCCFRSILVHGKN